MYGNLFPCDGEFTGREYPVVVPCCWENLQISPHTVGVGVFTKEFEAEGTIRMVFKGVSHTAKAIVDGEGSQELITMHIHHFSGGKRKMWLHKLKSYVDNRLPSG